MPTLNLGASSSLFERNKYVTLWLITISHLTDKMSVSQARNLCVSCCNSRKKTRKVFTPWRKWWWIRYLVFDISCSVWKTLCNTFENFSKNFSSNVHLFLQISMKLRGVRFQMGFPVLEKKAEIKMAEYNVASSRKPDVKKVYSDDWSIYV